VDEVIWPPARPEEILSRYATTIERQNSVTESARLRAEVVSQQGYFDLIGASPSMHRVFEQIDRVAPTDATVLIGGETGTGKELVARAIHAASHRHDGPFVAVNMAAIPETLMESELFGHEAGAFTGARHARPGRFEAVSGGTLFLDEVGELPASAQVKLLRVLQERKFERVGSQQARAANFRLVCATHRDLQERIREGAFREDLYYRINVVRLDLPPLRERRQDIPLLAEYFLGAYAKQLGVSGVRFGEDALEELSNHSWPGNVRELRHAIERAVAMSRNGETLSTGFLEARETRRSFRAMADEFLREGRTLDELIEDIERTVLVETLARFDGNQSVVAKKLGIARTTLRSRMKKLGI
jgi:DNA-binding NtrC family response regulator